MMAQSCHAATTFFNEYKEVANAWIFHSNYIAILECEDENALIKLADKADKKDIKFSVFFEPDMDNEITAIALEPGTISKKLCSNFRLALSSKRK